MNTRNEGDPSGTTARGWDVFSCVSKSAGDFLKHGLLGLTPKVSKSVGQNSGLRTYISNESLHYTDGEGPGVKL